MSSLCSDPTLVAEVRQYGLFDTNACLQCGSCTVICNLTDRYVSFPRRIFRYTLLGLRQPLLSSVEPWLCYYCGDCSQSCPPANRTCRSHDDSAPILNHPIRLDGTGNQNSPLPGLAYPLPCDPEHSRSNAHPRLSSLAVETGPGEFLSTPMGLEHMFSTIQYFTLIVIAIPLVLVSINSIRMYRFVFREGNMGRLPWTVFLSQAGTLIWHSLTQSRFRECKNPRRWITHLALVVSCLTMFFILIFFLGWFQADNLYPLYHPQRWLGYLITLMHIYVPVDILIGRWKKKDEIHKYTREPDLVFLILLLLTALSGIAVHIFRYAGLSLTSHFAYALHIAIVVPMLIIEIPFGKWSHMLYRPLAIYFQTIKEKALQAQEVAV